MDLVSISEADNLFEIFSPDIDKLAKDGDKDSTRLKEANKWRKKTAPSHEAKQNREEQFVKHTSSFLRKFSESLN